jgi:hypothetical protein
MTRRRLILAACVAVVALGAAWWYYGDGLTAQERRLVGRWQTSGPEGQGTIEVEFLADREFAIFVDGRRTSASRRMRWKVADGRMVVDCEMSQWRRLARPLLSVLGVSVQHVEVVRVEVDGGNLTLTNKFAKRTVWTRDRGD